MGIEKQYLEMLEDIMENGVFKGDRTGTGTKAVFSRTLRHDMSKGFPLLTTKRVAWKTMKIELEGFIKGITSKSWFQDRGCKIWDEWCNPQKVPYANDEETKQKMAEEDDLGACIYGGSWRNFHDPRIGQHGYGEANPNNIPDISYGVDQLKYIIDKLNTDINDRRMVCMAWNPMGLNHTALPPCHLGFIVNVLDGKLNLEWWQRSADSFLGVPFNIASYALLLHLLAKEAGLKEGELVGHFTDVHIYTNHFDQIKEQLGRDIRELPTIETPEFESVFSWNFFDTHLIDYKPHPAIKGKVAV